ncbi:MULTISPECIES: cytochrome b [unclassified Aureimonas]|uniref:cytochrome b n=1 Tax=unclassified Aureimonas TaxID=2615206 RepID=UPI000702014A|nr:MULTISPECIES: cytochrome b/b6 domain-containing protein [unclassified Aureimonas]KQT53043.1 hypothetical protein ASG62_14175 [Aureimonas sp. Leaf427]KQT80499.1 hypothetical protein ASG54_08025 [Aureimonas sp. Leaf460]
MNALLQDHAPATRTRPRGWSRLHVVLHWLVVVLIAVQYVDRESMETLFDATFEGRSIQTFDMVLGWTHIAVGSAILGAMAIRLVDRIACGRPPHGAAEPGWARWLASATHALLYVVLLAMPALGLLAWITGSETSADLHTLLWTPLLVLIGLHVAGALAQSLWFRSGALAQMTSLRGRF